MIFAQRRMQHSRWRISKNVWLCQIFKERLAVPEFQRQEDRHHTPRNRFAGWCSGGSSSIIIIGQVIGRIGIAEKGGGSENARRKDSRSGYQAPSTTELRFVRGQIWSSVSPELNAIRFLPKLVCHGRQSDFSWCLWASCTLSDSRLRPQKSGLKAGLVATNTVNNFSTNELQPPPSTHLGGRFPFKVFESQSTQLSWNRARHSQQRHY
jgi:hypothetical protein